MKRLRMLLFMRRATYDRHFEAALRELLRRGHVVHVVFDADKSIRPGSTELYERLQAEGGALTFGLAPPRRKVAWLHFGTKLRLAIDYLRYHDPRFEDADVLRARAESRSPRFVKWAAGLPMLRRPAGIRALDRLLRVPERALPTDPSILELMDDFEPDVVLVTPLVGLGSPQGDYIRAARLRGIPTALLVASWDNLTNKGVVRDPPDLTAVWNEVQLRECVELHGLAPESVAVVGAHTYDHWFDWRPSTTREEFCAKVGLDPGRPIVLYLCSSGFIAPDEAGFVARWLRLLRSSAEPSLREAGVLVRPHPANTRMWEDLDLAQPGRVAVWPREGASPTSDERKADYFDSIHHADVVVGINTSALIESAIVGRPVLTLVTRDFARTQEGTLHFHYLTGDDGMLIVARSEQEHLAQLSEALAGRLDTAARQQRFLESFVRPQGRERAGASVLADELEALAGRDVPAPRPAPLRPVLRAALAPMVHGGVALAARVRQERRPKAEKLRDRSQPRPEGHPLRILFCFEHPGSLLHFDETIRGLGERGHRVHVAFGRTAKYEHALELLRAAKNVVVHEKVPARRDRYSVPAQVYRALMDYVHYLDPALAEATYSRHKWRDLAPVPSLLRFLGAETLPRRVVGLLLRTLGWLEAAVPSSPAVERFLARIDPDVVIVSPLITRSMLQTDVVKSARALRIPSALCVSSWDNLTSKAFIRIVPDRVIAWNDIQRAEAVEYHRIDPARIVTTGAQQFDRWFQRSPSTSREEFLGRLGLPEDKPLLLFVSSTRQNAAPGLEPGFVRRWVEALRASDDPLLREASVVIRPHPTDLERWERVDLSGLGNVVVQRRDRPLPVGDDGRSEYFDALYHAAAVVGINSTAMIEATIIGRPVHTVCLPEFRALQHDLLHFHYLRRTRGGFLREAKSLDEHCRLLAADLRHPGADEAVRQAFVASFIRPHGPESEATSILMSEIERAADVVPERVRSRGLALVPARAMAYAIWVLDVMRLFGYRAVRRLAGIGRRVAGATAVGRFLARVENRSRLAVKTGAALRGRKSAGAAANAPDGPLKILFLIRHGGFVRNFESAIRALAERGHEVEVVVKHWRIDWLDEHPVRALAAEYPNVAGTKEPPRRRRILRRVEQRLRTSLDYLHYLRPEFDGAPKLRRRAEDAAPVLLRALRPILRRRHARGLCYALLHGLERAIPPDPAVRRFLAEREPDVLLITPLVQLASSQHDYLRAASRLGIPTIASIASWDNLTTKGVIRHQPTLVTVWNEAQRAEAVAIHGVAPERVIATGAQSYDHWFDWGPYATREELAFVTGLRADRPIVLYVCSSRFVAPEEVPFVLRWIETVRATTGLEEAGLLIRPHPQNAEQWEEADLSDLGQVAVWPPSGADPVDESAKRAFYDSIYHSCAVVGINTSALIESAIVGRPVLTVVDDAFGETQTGTFHFSYLADGERALLHTSGSLAKHAAQLARVAAESGAAPNGSRNAAFLKAFVRPHGLSRPATPRLVSVVEDLARGKAVAGPREVSLGLLPPAWRGVRHAAVPQRAKSPVRRAWRRRLRPLVMRPVRIALEATHLPVVDRWLAARAERQRALDEERARLKAARAEAKRKAALKKAKKARERQPVG